MEGDREDCQDGGRREGQGLYGRCRCAPGLRTYPIGHTQRMIFTRTAPGWFIFCSTDCVPHRVVQDLAVRPDPGLSSSNRAPDIRIYSHQRSFERDALLSTIDISGSRICHACQRMLVRQPSPESVVCIVQCSGEAMGSGGPRYSKH